VNFKTTYALFGALIVIIGIAAVMLMTGPKPGDESLLLQGPKSLKLAAKDFDTFTIERKAPQGETMAFQRIGETQWKMIKPDEARVDSSAVDRAIDDLLSARRESKGEGSKDLKQLGLEPPSLVMTLAKSGGPTFTVSLATPRRAPAAMSSQSLTNDRTRRWRFAAHRSRLC